MQSILWSAALAVSAVNGAAQDPNSPAERTPVGPEAPQASKPLADVLEIPGEPILGTHQEFALDESALDDAVPLPEKAEYAPGVDGADVLVKPAGGDPYFLGFAAAKYYPPKDELIDPALVSLLRASYADGRPTNETYAFVMFQKRMTRARLDALAAAGARVLEFHPHYCLKVALSADELDSIAALDFVRWIGVPRAAQKVHPNMARAIAELPQGELIEAQISVFDSDLNASSTTTAAGAVEAGGPDGAQTMTTALDTGARVVRSNGWQQKGLEALGVDVREWEESPRAFRVRLHPSQLSMLRDLDFVQFIEPRFTPSLAHDESMPLISLDRTRYLFDGSTLNDAVVGEADSGIETAHNGFTNFYWWANNLTGGGESTTDDLCGHGSHVAGTIMGTGSLEDSYEGAAAGVATTSTARFFITKIFSGGGCSWGGTTMSAILGAMDNSITDGSGNVTPKPHVINHSWGTLGSGWIGSEADCRTIDSSVYTHKQLQVWAAGNEGSSASTLRQQAASKNAFTIGSVRDYMSGSEEPGTISPSSSRGPCADGRWKPNVCAPGTSIMSIDSGDVNGYTSKSGTSMATPHVTGLAAQLVDHQPFFQYNAASLAATLMATAITKDDQVLTSPSISAAHFNAYGTGRVEAYKAHYGGSQLGLAYWGWDQGSSGWSEVSFDVNAGATRVVACFTYHEGASSAGASQALVNDFDMWLDAPPLTAGGNTGEYSAQQSGVDNTEIRIVNNPTTGTWKLKVFPDSVTGVAHVGVCVSVIYGDTTPPADLTVTASKIYEKPNVDVDYTAVAANSDYFASAVFLSTFLPADATITAASTTLKDGAVTDLMSNQQNGADVLLGNIKYGESRTAKWKARWSTEGWKNFQVILDSDNMAGSSATAVVGIDGTGPGAVTGLTSPTHQAGVWSNDASFTLNWTAANDNLSGIDGYSLVSGSGPSLPGALKTIGAVTTYSATLTMPVTQPYINIRAVDKAGNWSGSYGSWGPIFFDNQQPEYITGLTSSTHLPNVQSCNDQITITWDPEEDVGPSGIAGYCTVWDHNPVTQPVLPLQIIGNPTSASYVLASDAQPWYFHITPVDNAGNSQNSFHTGPYYVNTSPVSTYCTPKVNSLGCTPAIGFSGTPSLSNSTLHVTVSKVLNNKNGLLFWGMTSSSAPFQGGTLCVGLPIKRTSVQNTGGNPPPNDCSGTMDFFWSSAQLAAEGLTVGQTVYNQYWSRDPQSPSTTSLSAGVRFTICQ